MIKVTNKAECCGCNACGDICPKGSITFETDAEGFLYPKVNHDTCIACHLCEKVCPIIHSDDLKKNDYKEPKCYAAQAKNLESLFNSTSGSAFATLAERMYKIGGYVGGAIFNEDYTVTQFISSSKEDLEKLRNSKYVQSDSQGFYKQVREILNEGNKVLVCGLPCQMAALRSFLRKDYDNLIIVDLICLGINSPKILRGYLDYMEEKHNSKIIYYKAKNKELGWRQLTTKIVFENGDVEYDKKDTNYFTHGFIATHAFSRPSCYECRFKGFPRIADITIGDLWGAERIVGKEYDHDLGTSVVMINSKKGESYYEEAKTAFRDKLIPFETTLGGNKALLSPLSKPNIDREIFYNDLNNLKFESFAKKYIKLPVDHPTAKDKLKYLIRFWYHVMVSSGINIKTLWQNIYYNLLCKNIKTSILEGKFIIVRKHCVINISKTARIKIGGILLLGNKRVKGSTLETKLLVEDSSTLIANGGTIGYGADIEVFPNATLELGAGIAFNTKSTIICGDHIVIGDNVCFGREVTVRDNSGEHYMSRRMFKNKRPVSIGQHSWICEQAIVMPGAKIGVGVVVSARSVVSGKLKNFVLASGSPAEVVDEDVYWKA